MEVINKIGRRKCAVARIYMTLGNGNITINGKDYKEYFPTPTLQYILRQACGTVGAEGKDDVKANLDGGALCEINLEDRPALKSIGLLRRDPRMVERKKPGQKKARKRFQFSKR